MTLLRALIHQDKVQVSHNLLFKNKYSDLSAACHIQTGNVHRG